MFTSPSKESISSTFSSASSNDIEDADDADLEIAGIHQQIVGYSGEPEVSVCCLHTFLRLIVSKKWHYNRWT